MSFLNRIKQKVKQLLKPKTIFVFGDSHADIFNDINKIYKSRKFYFDVTWVGGATAQGMLNPNSVTNSLETFGNKIKKINDKYAKLIFQLGEVDTGFLIWYRAQKYNESVELQFNRSIQNFFSFLEEVKKLGFRSMYVMSAPLPTIKDNQTWGEIANLRKEVKASQLERTALTIKYNKALQALCKQHGFTFIDLDNELLDTETGLIKSKFINKDVNNHHLDLDEYARVSYLECKRILHLPFTKYLYYGFRNKLMPFKPVPSQQSIQKNQVDALVERYGRKYKGKEILPDVNTQPVWILGMFRSGTSLVCDFMQSMDASFGDDSHLLQAKGILKDLNPNGFFENFIFAEYSRYFFHLLNSGGDDPPNIEEVHKLDWKQADIEKMIRYSFDVIKEDRISFEDKIDAFKSLCQLGLNDYLKVKIGRKSPCVKIPMMSFLTPLIIKNWPASKFLIVFRNPDSVIKSSQVLSKKSDFNLYLKYNQHLLAFAESNKNVSFISYDNLINQPEYSAQQLAEIFDLNKNKIKSAASKVDKNLFRNRPEDAQKVNWPEQVRAVYDAMLSKAINR